MVLITILTGAYKPIYNWGGPHCKCSWYSEPSCSDPWEYIHSNNDQSYTYVCLFQAPLGNQGNHKRNKIGSTTPKNWKNNGWTKPRDFDALFVSYVFLIFSRFLQFFIFPDFFSNISDFSLATSIFSLFFWKGKKLKKTSRKIGNT